MLELEQVLISVWRQTLVDGAKYVQLGTEKYPIREISRRRLKQIDFEFDGKQLRGLEQNPEHKIQMGAASPFGQKVMQFLENGRYIAVVVDGKMKIYGQAETESREDIAWSRGGLTVGRTDD